MINCDGRGRLEIKHLGEYLIKVCSGCPACQPPQEEMGAMGVSQWREHGKKHGYWEYFEGVAPAQHDKEIAELREAMKSVPSDPDHNKPDKVCAWCLIEMLTAFDAKREEQIKRREGK